MMFRNIRFKLVAYTALFVLAVGGTLVSHLLRGTGLTLTFLLLLAGVFLAYFYSKNLSTPIQTLLKATRDIQKGGFGFRNPFKRRDELGALAQALEGLAEILKNTMVSKDSLAEEIADRKEVERALIRTQAQLVQSAKMATVGHLVSGIAHEINNPLQAIRTNLETANLMLKEEWKQETKEEFKEVVMETHLASKRCQEIVQDLLNYARPSKEFEEKMDLAIPLNEALTLIRSLLDKTKIRVEQIWPKTLSPVKGNTHALLQVFINLISNAIRAMSDSKERLLKITGEQKGGKVRISFQDTGCGIPLKDIPHIFEPFYTTSYEHGVKELKGTGLGLAISQRIIEAHQGKILVASQENQGATFTVVLPVA